MNRDWFDKLLRTALNELYNPKALRDSPLAALFEVRGKNQPAFELQQILLNAIETLRPGEQAPPGSRAWRLYQILRKRYTEQIPQPQVAYDLGLSVRQLQREESLARAVLSDHLWTRYHLDQPAAAPIPQSDSPEATARVHEIEHLRDQVASELLQIGGVLEEIFDLLAPLLEKKELVLDYQAREPLPLLFLQEPVLKQGLLEIFSAALEKARGGQIHVEVQPGPGDLRIEIRASAARDLSEPAFANRLELAAHLIRLCEGTLETAAAQGFYARVSLPAVRPVPVLIIDDNADTVQLYRRYLAGSRYYLVSAQDITSAFACIREFQPRLIVLDVMLPGKDGWAILGELREHPATRALPVIICTILQQEELAQALGAAGFLHKPFNRAQFLQALDQHIT